MNQSKPIKNRQIAEIKTNLEAINSRLNNTEEGISDLEDKIMEITQSGQQKDKLKKKKKRKESNI